MIELSDVHHSFGEATVLSGVDLTVEPGEFVALVGPNGAGKTTLLGAINGLIEPDAGRVTLAGTAVSSLSSKEVSKQVATVPQDTHVGFSFTVEQIVAMGRTPHRSRLDWSEETVPVERALERTETLELRDRAVDTLSGGERQRVLLARALAQEPSTLLLDEPTASLDINHQRQVLGIVDALVDEGQAALAAIHDLDLASRFCDRLVLLADGEICASGDPADVLTDSALETAFGTRTAVTRNPATGTPTIAAIEGPTETGRVHIAGGGRGAQCALRTLWQAGFEVSLGPVPAGDTAQQLADQLGCETVVASAFQSLDDSTRQRAIRCCREANVLVLSGGPGSAVLAGESSPLQRIHADLAGSVTAPTDTARHPLGNGGESTGVRVTVDTGAELLAAVRECLDQDTTEHRLRKRGE